MRVPSWAAALRRLAVVMLGALPAFAASAAEDVPFIVTPDHVTAAMLHLARVGPRDYVVDLGSGDGRIVILAARRFGARGLGVEIDPTLVEKSRQAAQAAGVAARAHFREQDLFKTDLSPATVVTLYLLPEVNLQLRPRLLGLRAGTRIVSHDWDMAEWEPDQTVVVEVPDKAVGLEKTSKLHLWIVPSRVDGLWCGTGKARGTRLAIVQSFQKVRGEVGGVAFEGKVNGKAIRIQGGLALAVDGARLRTVAAGGRHAALRGASFTRPKGPSCP